MMQRRVLARSFAVTARLRGDASETMYGHGDWKNTDPEFVLARSKDEHIAKLKGTGWKYTLVYNLKKSYFIFLNFLEKVFGMTQIISFFDKNTH